MTNVFAQRSLQALVLLLSRVCWGAQDPGSAAETPFQPVALDLTVGETLAYKVSVGAISAGVNHMVVLAREEQEGGKSYRVYSRTRSKGLVNRLYSVNDSVTSWIDVKEGYSRGSILKQDESKVKSTQSIKFDFGFEKTRAHVHREKVKRGKRQVHDYVLDVPRRTHDALSCIYYLRGFDFSKEAPPPFVVVTNRKVYKVRVRVKGRKKIKIKLNGRKRTLNTIEVVPEADPPGAFSKKGDMTLWLEERTRIPVRIRIDAPVASVTLTLKSTRNAPLK